jgi:4a-hydroxytetrahydrobiopterin dehydratase
MEPKFSAGADTSKLIEETNALLEAGWTLNKEQMGIEKTYYFKTYTKALVGYSYINAALSDNCRTFSSTLGYEVNPKTTIRR